MKKMFCILIVFAFLLFYCLSCDKASNPVQSDISSETGTIKLAKGNPAKDELPPSIDVLQVRNLEVDGAPNNNENPVSLPYGPAIIHYEVSDNVGITEVIIEILCDNDNDNKWEIMFSERLFRQDLTFDGSQKSITGDLFWDGSVKAGYSDDGYVFDQLATENPDVYLINFEVRDGQHFTLNWLPGDPDDLIIEVGPNSMIFVDPIRTREEFHITEISAYANTPQTRKGRYAAELSATVVCSAGGFRGSGKWVQVYGNEEGPIEYRSGSPYCSFNDDDGNTTASTTTTLLVGPGIYRYYVKLSYNPSYSYDPSLNKNTFDEITVQ